MRLTTRDRQMFQWINGHGFVTLPQAATWMDASYYAARRRLRVLVDNGYLERKRFEHGGARVHWLTTKGWEVSSDSLAPPKAINRITYFHDTTLVDVALTVAAQTGGSFFPERRLRADLLAKGRRTQSHLPDGLLYIDGRKPIAIELEMSVKTIDRLDRIISGYITNLRLEEVWYFVTNKDVRNAVERTIGSYDGFKVISWEGAA